VVASIIAFLIILNTVNNRKTVTKWYVNKVDQFNHEFFQRSLPVYNFMLSNVISSPFQNDDKTVSPNPIISSIEKFDAPRMNLICKYITVNFRCKSNNVTYV